MASIDARILEALPKRTQLLENIANLSVGDDAAIAASEEYMQDLKDQIAHQNDHAYDAAHLRRRAEQGWKPDENRETRTVRRLGAMLRGKKAEFDANGKQEESKWRQAMEEEQKEKDVKKELQATLQTAEQSHDQLEVVHRKWLQSQKQLDLLYEAVFRGPLPPECAAVDLAECYVEPARVAMEEARKEAENERQAARSLASALDTLNAALGSMDDAQRASTGPFTSDNSSQHVRRYMIQAENKLGETRQQVAQAQNLVPEIKGLPPVQYTGNNVGMTTERLFSDASFHSRIYKAQAEAKTMRSLLEKEVARANQRVKLAQGPFEDAKMEWESARIGLRKAREVTFQKMLGAAGGGRSESGPSQLVQPQSAQREPPPYKP